MLKLLYQTLRALAKRTIPLRLVRRIFELKAVTINGEGPQVLNCVSCGAEGEADCSAPAGAAWYAKTAPGRRWMPSLCIRPYSTPCSLLQ